MSETDVVVSNVALHHVTESISEECSTDTTENEMSLEEMSKAPQVEPVVIEENEDSNNHLERVISDAQTESKADIKESNDNCDKGEGEKYITTLVKENDSTSSTNQETLTSDVVTELNENKDASAADENNPEKKSPKVSQENTSCLDKVDENSDVTEMPPITSSQSGEIASEETKTHEPNETKDLAKDADPVEEEKDSKVTVTQNNDADKKEGPSMVMQSQVDIGIKDAQLPQKESDKAENISQDTPQVEKIGESREIPLQENSLDKQEELSEILQTQGDTKENELPSSELQNVPLETLHVEEEEKETILEIKHQDEPEGSSKLIQSPADERKEVAQTAEAESMIQNTLPVKEDVDTNESASQDNILDKISQSSGLMQQPENAGEKESQSCEVEHIFTETLAVKEVEESKESILQNDDQDQKKQSEILESTADDCRETDAEISEKKDAPKEVDTAKEILLQDTASDKKEESQESIQKPGENKEQEEQSLEKESSEVQSIDIVIPSDDEKKVGDEQKEVTDFKDPEAITTENNVEECLLKEDTIVEEPTEISKVDNQENLDKPTAEISSEIEKQQKENVTDEIEIIEKLRDVVSELERQDSNHQCDDKVSEEVKGDKVEEIVEVQKEYGSMGVLGASITYAYNKLFG